MDESSWILTPIQDEPIEEATLFGFDKKSEEIVDFLISEKTITPFVIAIHGEWGSGKSSLLLTIKNKLVKKIAKDPQKMKVVYFDAWKYESANPAAALVYHMIKPIENNRIILAMNVGKLTIDVIARNSLGISLNEMKNHFEQSVQAVDTLTDQVRKTLNSSLPNGRLIVLIDDLDRCTIENTLDILNSIKLFLSLKQCIFVVAVDMKKVELAWKTRYGKDKDLLQEGSSYLEKIFQIRTNVPIKTEDHLEEYVMSLITNIPSLYAKLIATAGPKNLRKLKRLLNLASFLASTGEIKLRKYELAILWVLFEYIMDSNEKAVQVFKRIPLETGHPFFKWVKEMINTESLDICRNVLSNNPAFQKAGGVPSKNDELMYQYMKQVKLIVSDFMVDQNDLNDSMSEIVSASEESNE